MLTTTTTTNTSTTLLRVEGSGLLGSWGSGPSFRGLGLGASLNERGSQNFEGNLWLFLCFARFGRN